MRMEKRKEISMTKKRSGSGTGKSARTHPN